LVELSCHLCDDIHYSSGQLNMLSQYDISSHAL